MGEIIWHRGPDDGGEYQCEGMAFGMRRLSIIDLEGGHQPISNEDGTVWLVCNGEIYNFREIRENLQAQGHHFRSESDAEVIVHLYEEEGLEFIHRLRGMFAFALWDTKQSRLILARDRIGKKPLYWRREPNRVLFASEIKSILEVDNIPRRVDHKALQEFLALGYVPAPFTMFEGINKVLPGHMLVMTPSGINEHEYWDVKTDQREAFSEDEWVERVQSKLLESINMRLVSDVPLGAFLSGGVDSSSIVAAMAQFSDKPVKTYSIGYEGSDDFYNELPFAKIVAQEFGTEHHEIIVRPEVSELLPKLIWHMDEPIADSALITTFLVSELAKDSVKVILSGVGGDELFGGYRRYLGAHFNSYFGKLPPVLRKQIIPKLLAWLPQDRHSSWKNYVRYAHAFVKASELDPASRYMSYVTIFTPEVQSILLKSYQSEEDAYLESAGSPILGNYIRKYPEARELNQIMYGDMKTSLPDDLLLLTDKMSMAASIECRAPFLDHELVNLASQVPTQLKIKGTALKYLLKRAVKPWLPTQILERSKKGFGAPIGAWLRKDLRSLIGELLSESRVKQRGMFHWPAVQEVIASHETFQTDNTDQLLSLITFELWCETFLDGKGYRPPSRV